MIALLLSLAVAAPMQPRQACATRLVATSATLTAGGLDGIEALVVQCSPDYGACRVQVRLLVYPTNSAAFP